MRKIMFELEVDNNFNAYNFFKRFKQIQYKGFFDGVVRICKLDEKGNPEPERHIEKREEFIKMQAYGVK